MILEVYSAHGGARYWRRLLGEWQSAGHTVREICAFDDAVYRRTRGAAGRLWLRLLTYVFFPLRVWFQIRFGRRPEHTVRVVITSPFFLPFVVIKSPGGGRRAPIVNILNDLYPDALIQAGLLQRGRWPARWLGRMTRACFRECECTVFLGEHIRAYAEAKYGRARSGRIIPVGADSTFVSAKPPTRTLEPLPLRILYSGTMGHMHDIDTVLEVIRRGLPPGVQLAFHSSGVGYGRMCRAVDGFGGVPGSQLSLLGPLPDQDWREVLNRYPVGLVTLKDGAQCVSMPSKTYSALAAGQAVLAVCALDSDLADLVRKHNCGWVVAPGQADELASLFDRLAGSPDEVHAKRMEAFRAGHSLYDMAAVSEQYLDLFKALMGEEGPVAGKHG